ncbi:YkgJ family cysteine cluster protein [Burkholderia sp. 22PA0099]|uniref:YkgJ family cysteine cluster protein n=1 Tax=Burkholderia sp. 22PA0099 TaxID=3237372 RepID=UPI0039C08FDB
MSIHFSCTRCGQCCHDLRLPLAVDEAAAWLARGGAVQVFCDAIPWPAEPPGDPVLVRHRRQRSFAAHCGALPVRVSVTLVAAFAGACPHLRADLTCGAYEQRPRVCRIYPAEVNPAVSLDPAAKACPPEAWAASQPVFQRAGTLVDAQTADLIAQSRHADAQDRMTKAYLCAELGYDRAALANEGFVIYSPDRARLRAALDTAREAASNARVAGEDGGDGGNGIETSRDPRSPHAWRYVSNRSATLDTLREIDADAERVGTQQAGDAFSYLGFFVEDAPG